MERKDYLSIDKSKDLSEDYNSWKITRINEPGWFPIFSEFKDNGLLKDLSGNALRLYIFLGINSKNDTGVSWYSLNSIANYFNKSERTISNWLEELKNYNLIERIQPDRSSSAITFLKPYKKERR